MRVARVFTAWLTVVVAVISWILFVPIVNLLGSFFNRLGLLGGARPGPGVGASVDAPESDARPAQSTHSKRHRKTGWRDLLLPP